EPSQRNEEQALRLAAIGLARAYVFGMRHREQATFEQLIRLWIGTFVEIERLEGFVRTVERDPFYVRLEELPYQRPTLRRWTEAWDVSVAFFSDFVVEVQVHEQLAHIEEQLKQPEEQRQATLREELRQVTMQVRQQLEESLRVGRRPSDVLLQVQQRV